MKDAYYFSHDANARHDPRILILRARFKEAGYAWYFMTLEMMREAHDYQLKNDDYIYAVLGLEFGVAPDLAKRFMDSCVELDLFKSGDSFYSESLLRRMQQKEKMTTARRESGRIGGIRSGEIRASLPDPDIESKARYRNVLNTAVKSGRVIKNICEVCGEIDTEAHHEDYNKPLEVKWLCKAHHMAVHNEAKTKQNPSKTEAVKESKGKESKEKEVKKEYSPDFLAFWQAYPNKTGKDKAFEAWIKKAPILETCLSALKWQTAQPQWAKEGGKYIPHPTTWLNQGRWNDEPITARAGSSAGPIAGKYDGIGERV